MIDDIHYLGGVKLPSGGFISQLTDLSPQNNHVFLRGMAAGHPQPLFGAIMGAKPEILFTTPQLKTLLDGTGLFGLDTSEGNTDFFFRRGKNLGSRQADSGGDHKRIRATKGLLYWLELTLDYQQVATARVRYKPVSIDGSTVPYVPLGTISLTDAPTAAEQFTLGPVYVDSTLLPGIKRLTISMQPRMLEDGAGDDLFDVYCGLDEVEPTITFDGVSWARWLDYGLTGNDLAGIEIYLRRKEQDKAHYAKNTAVHISIIGGSGLGVVPQSNAGGPNMPVRTGVQLVPRATNASTDIFAINTATTIPV